MQPTPRVRWLRCLRHLPCAVMALALCAAPARGFAAPAGDAPIRAAAPAEPPARPGPARVVLVLQEGAILRAAARESSPAQAQMLRGEAVEVRGERLDWYQVWDYGRERGGYLRRAQTVALAPDTATLLAQLRVVLLQDNAEGLALGLAAAYVQAATGQELASPDGIEVLDAIGQLGQRIAAHGGARRAGLLDVAARYGIRLTSFEQADGSVRVCDDGAAYRRVLGLPGAPAPKARAALALTRPECGAVALNGIPSPSASERAPSGGRAALTGVPSPSASERAPSGGRAALTPSQRAAQDDWRAEVLSHAVLDGLAGYERNRLLLRRASVAASRAFARQDPGIASAALADFARIEPTELSEDDLADYNDTAMRVNAMRWLAVAPVAERRFAQGLRLTLVEGHGPGERCLQLVGARGETLARRCTLAQVALASAQINREGTAIAIAAQPLDGWRELWVLRAGPTAWTVDALPPAAAVPGLGYAEFAGWVPGGRQLLLATESRAEGRYASRRFVQMDLATLAPQRQALEAGQLGSFQRWADPLWRGASLALR